MTDTAILLVGGRGTRLGTLTEQTPKPLLPVAGRPFLFHVLDYLARQGLKHVTLATGYLGDAFEKTVGRSYQHLSINYSHELEPLGTGGAIVHAFKQVQASSAFVLNGDTCFPADLVELANIHATKRAAFSMVLRRVPDVARYGSVSVENNLVTAMHEKGGAGPGLINGGIYLVERSALLADSPAGVFSLEKELLPLWIAGRSVACTVSDAYFIDIGIPADLERAQRELA